MNLRKLNTKEGPCKDSYNKKVYLELIRIIAVILVIINHSDLYYTFYTYTDNLITFSISLLISSICRINVPLFIMITGAVLIPKAENWREIFKKRVSKSIIILLFCSAIMYFLKCFVWQQNTFSLVDFFQRLMTKDIHVSYWYLYRYLEILLILPIINMIVKSMDKDFMKYFLGISILGIVFVPIVAKFTGYMFPIRFFIMDEAVFYMIMGYYLENNISKDIIEKISYIKILFGMLVSVILTIIMVVLEKHCKGQYSENTLNIMVPVIAVLVFLACKKIFMSGISEKLANRISTLGSCVFGVYLMEYIGQKLFGKFYLWLCDKTWGVIACSIYVACILISAFIMVFCLKKIKLIKKYL